MMVKTFNLCAPSLSEGSAFKPINEFFSTVDFPINLTIRNLCPFALIIPCAGVELAHVSSEKSVGTFEIKCLPHLMGLVSSVEQIAELNRIKHGATLCFAMPDVIEEPAEEACEEPAPEVESTPAPAVRRRGRPSRKNAKTA